MGGNFSTRVTIPQVEPEVGGVAEYRAPVARAPDVSSGLEKGAQQVAQVTSEFSKMLIEQGRHQQIIDAAGAEEKVKDQFSQIRVDAQQLPGNQQLDYVKQQTDAVSKQILQDPNNAHIRGYLGQRIPELRGIIVDDARVHAATATMADQKAEMDKLDQKMAANDIAGDYKIGPDGKFVDGPQAAAARQQVYNRYDALHPKDTILSDANKRDFDARAAMERAQFIAQNKPDDLNKYLTSLQGQFSPEQLNNFQRLARDAYEAPYHMAQAQHEAEAQKARDQIDEMVKNHDPNLYKTAYAAVKAEFISREHFEDVTGTKWKDPAVRTDPALMNSYAKDIADDPYRLSEADIAAIPSDQISPDDRRILRATRSDAVQKAKGAVGSQLIRSKDDIRNQLHNKIASSIDAEGQRLKVEGAIGDLDALVKDGTIRSAADVQKYSQQIIDANTRGRKTVKPSREHIVGPLPPGVAANAASEARKRNWEPSGPAGSD
jgi:hypothetical protein